MADRGSTEDPVEEGTAREGRAQGDPVHEDDLGPLPARPAEGPPATVRPLGDDAAPDRSAPGSARAPSKEGSRRAPRPRGSGAGPRPRGLFPDAATAVAGAAAVALMAVAALAVTLLAPGLPTGWPALLLNAAGGAAVALLGALVARHALDPPMAASPPRLDADPARSKAKREVAMEAAQTLLVVLTVATGLVAAAAIVGALLPADAPPPAVDALRGAWTAVLVAFAAVVVAALAVRSWGPGARRVRTGTALLPLLAGLAAAGAALALQTGALPAALLPTAQAPVPADGTLLLSAGFAAIGAFVLWQASLPNPFGAFLAQVRDLSRMRESLRQRLVLVGLLAGSFTLVGLSTSFVLAGGTGVVDLGDPLNLAAAVTATLVTTVVITVFAFLITGRFAASTEDDPVERDRVGAKQRWTAEQMRRAAILAGSGVTAAMLAVLAVATALGQTGVAATFANDLAVAAILVGIGPYGLEVYLQRRRILEIEEKFPDLLRDLNESQKAGMTLPEALRSAAKQNYGVLTEEVKKMAAEISWGVSFEESLRNFADRVGTPLVKRSVALVLQATRAGGDVDEILSAAARDAREIRVIEEERRLGLSVYVMIVYIAFFVFLVVVAIMAASFIPAMAEAGSQAEQATNVGTIGLSAADPRSFNLLFFHAAVIQALGGGLVAGVMGEGYREAGLKHAVVLLLVAYVAFRFLIGL